MSTTLLVLGCLFCGSGMVLYLLISPVGEDSVLNPARRFQFSPRPAPPSPQAALGRPPRPGPVADSGDTCDFMLWEREMLSTRRLGSECDQRARRDIERWERNSRRRGREREI